MTVQRTGERLTLRQQLSRKPEYKNRPLRLEARVRGHLIRLTDVFSAMGHCQDLQVEFRTSGGHLMDLASLRMRFGKELKLKYAYDLLREIDAIAEEVDRIMAAIDVRDAGTLLMPTMVVVPRESFSIMREEAIVAQFNQFLEGDKYEITGVGAGKLKGRLAGPGGEILQEASGNDAVAYANWLSRTTGGRQFRLPTAHEWLAARRKLDEWEWPPGSFNLTLDGDSVVAHNANRFMEMSAALYRGLAVGRGERVAGNTICLVEVLSAE